MLPTNSQTARRIYSGFIIPVLSNYATTEAVLKLVEYSSYAARCPLDAQLSYANM